MYGRSLVIDASQRCDSAGQRYATPRYGQSPY